MARPLVILGTSGLAREMATLAQHMDPTGARWELLGYVGPDESELPRARWLGPDEWLDAVTEPTDVVVGIGRPDIRSAVAERARKNPALAFPNLVHPTAVQGGEASGITLGVGNAICGGAQLTCDIEIGNFNLINLNATVGHDVVLGDANVINPGANLSGFSRLGNRTLLGTGCQLLEQVVIGDGATVGAGAVVNRDVAAGTTVVGVPARPLGSS